MVDQAAHEYEWGWPTIPPSLERYDLSYAQLAELHAVTRETYMMVRDSPAASSWSGRDKVALGLLDEAVREFHHYRGMWGEDGGSKCTLDRVVDANGVGPKTQMRWDNAVLSKVQVEVCTHSQYFKARALGA